MSESEVLGRPFSLAAKLLGMIHQIKVIFESTEAGAAGGKVPLVCVYRSPATSVLWGCAHPPSPLGQKNPSPTLAAPRAICTRWTW